MNILILGAGRTGGTLAEQLASEEFDVTLVDQDERRLTELRGRLDIQTVTGHASQPNVLREAGAEDADMLIAVTSSDEVNMVACQVCYSLFQTHQKVARIRAEAYTQRADETKRANEFFDSDHMPIDVIVNPERLVTEQIEQLLDNPGALQVLDFCDGRLQLMAVAVDRNDPLVDAPLSSLSERLPGVRVHPAAIFRRGQPFVPDPLTTVEPGDEICLLGERDQIARSLAELRPMSALKRITIAGGGNIGFQLAQKVESRLAVRVIEFDQNRAEQISRQINGLVIHGDATDSELLLNENIERTDVFCALTNDNEVNIMSALLAKRLGAKQAMSLIAKPAYADLVHATEVDIAISPQLATASAILTHVRRGHVQSVQRLRRGIAEAMEVTVTGEARYSRVVDRPVNSIRLPQDTTIGAVLHGDEVILGGHSEHRLTTGDTVVVFLADRRRSRAVENLFGVGLSYF